MVQIVKFLKALPRVLLTVGLVAAGVTALFVALWIALALMLGVAIYVAVRRMLPRQPPPRPGGGPVIIEGEYLEHEESPPHLRDRAGS